MLVQKTEWIIMVCHQVLADFFRTGVYDLRERSLACTISPAIDILVGSKIQTHLDQVSSNLERWLCLQLGQERVAELYRELAINKVGLFLFCCWSNSLPGVPPFRRWTEVGVPFLHRGRLVFRRGLQGRGHLLPLLHRLPARPTHSCRCCCCKTVQDSKGGKWKPSLILRNEDWQPACSWTILKQIESNYAIIATFQNEGILLMFINKMSRLLVPWRVLCILLQVPMLVLSTAHYSKFWDDLKTLVPISQTEVKRPGFHDGIRSCLQKPVVHRLFRISYLKIIITSLTKDLYIAFLTIIGPICRIQNVVVPKSGINFCRTVLEPKREPLIRLIKWPTFYFYHLFNIFIKGLHSSSWIFQEFCRWTLLPSQSVTDSQWMAVIMNLFVQIQIVLKFLKFL